MFRFCEYFTVKDCIASFFYFSVTPKMLPSNTGNKKMIKQVTIPPDKQSNPLLKNIPAQSRHSKTSGLTKKTGGTIGQHKVKICLESIHYSGKDYGYGWTFIISTLNHHWISDRVQIQRGKRSLVNKDVYNNVTDVAFDELQHLPITLHAHHLSGFNVETTLFLKPNSFKKNLIPKSIYTEVGHNNENYQFHEIQKINHEDTQLMFVLNIEIIPNVTQ